MCAKANMDAPSKKGRIPAYIKNWLHPQEASKLINRPLEAVGQMHFQPGATVVKSNELPYVTVSQPQQDRNGCIGMCLWFNPATQFDVTNNAVPS